MVKHTGTLPTTQKIYELLYRLYADQEGLVIDYVLDICEKDGTRKKVKGSTKDNPYILKEK